MPSLFSWRPKIQVKLKKLSHDSSPSSDGTAKSGGLGSPSSPLEEYNVESAPPLSNVLTEDEYFYAPSQRLSRGRESPSKGHRVRFEEGVDNSNNNNNKPSPSNHQTLPPVCNVIPNRGGERPAPTIVLNDQGIGVHANSNATARHEYFSNSPVPPNPISASPKWPQQHQNRLNETTAVTAAEEYIETVDQRENQQPPRPARYAQFNQQHQKQTMGNNRANLLLQQLRSEEVHSESESNVSVNENPNVSVYNHNSRLPPSPRPVGVGILYLQFNDETKRSLLPLNLHSVEQLRSLFMRSFPNLSMHYLNQPQVKIYIQDKSSKSQLFYELEDIKDVQNGSLLKLREYQQQHKHLQDLQTPPSIRFIDHLPASSSEYMSEPEFNGSIPRPSSQQPSIPPTYQPAIRPASVVPTSNHRSDLDCRRANGGKPPTSKPNLAYRQPSPSYDPYYDPYYASDSSSQSHCRSGSTTPVQIDSETRERMDTMERQLVGLSSLVHSALISKEMNPTAQREMMQLRKQIMDVQQPSYEEIQQDIATPKETRKAAGTLGVNQPLLHTIYKETRSTHAELKQLKRLAQVNAQASQDLLDEALIKVRKELRKAGLQPQTLPMISPRREEKVVDEMEKMRTHHLEQLVDVQNSLRLFESSMEHIRNSVLNSNRKLRMTEVEQLTNALTQIGKNAAKLKTRFPQLQTEIEKEIRINMENIVKQENYIKEEGQQVDNCLRRCKTLAGMMVTMKKLAMVQDPALKMHYNKKGDSTNKRLITKLTGIATAIHNNNNGGGSPTSQSDSDFKDKCVTKKSMAVGQMLVMNSPHVLDSILDELNTSNPKDIGNVTAAAASRSAPKPPERKRYNTTEAIKVYFNENGSSLPPNPMRQTDALDITGNSDNISRITVASTASTESINSQEGVKDGLAFSSIGSKNVA